MIDKIKRTDKAATVLAAIMVLIPGALILGLNALVWAYLLLTKVGGA